MVALKSISRRTGFALAVMGAAIVVGASTALVNAAIPDAGGTIHGCYRTGGVLQKGSLRVIDTDAAQTCNSNETALNWSQSGGSSGGAATVHDANGQALGTLLSAGSSGASVYNATLHRSFSMYPGQYNGEVEIGEVISPYFTTTDCSGTPYINSYNNGAKLTLFTWRNGGTPSYATVADNATADSTPVLQSILVVDEYNPGGTCHTDYTMPTDQSWYPLTTTSLPFTTPVALPFKY